MELVRAGSTSCFDLCCGALPCTCLPDSRAASPQVHIESGESVWSIEAPKGTFSSAWHPSRLLLAFAGSGEKERGGYISLFGMPDSA